MTLLLLRLRVKWNPES